MAYDYRFHIALDGNGLNGLEGLAGVCLFKYDSGTGSYAYKIVFYDGIAGGHAVAVNPSETVGYLGNTGQHLLFYDARDLSEIARVSTLRFEINDTTLRGSTHVVWLDDRTVLTPVGDFFYRFDLDALGAPERLTPHNVKLPHGMKRTASGRYLVYGSMDHPAKGESREVGILDLTTGNVTCVAMPTTCWHVVADPVDDRFYAVSFRVLPDERGNYHDWGIATYKEYAYEIDAPTGRIVRHWAAGRQVPAHINSDMALSRNELIFCNGASHTIILIDLQSFARYRIIDERPQIEEVLARPREVATQVFETFTRGSFFGRNQHFVGALGASRFAVLDSVYGCQLSADETLLFTANRGLNHITIYDYPSNEMRLRIPMPELQEFAPFVSAQADPRLGFHHSCLVSQRKLTEERAPDPIVELRLE